MEAGCTVAAVIENAASGPQGEPGSGDVLEGDTKAPADQDKKDGQDSDGNPADETKSQETITAMAKGDDITEPPAEHLLRSCVSTASMKVKNMKKLTFPRGHFPRLAECAHFHYETVDFGNVQLTFAEEQSEALKAGLDSKELIFLVQVTCQSRNWLVRRSYEDFRVLDKHLHLCIYDRRYSQLIELPRYNTLKDHTEPVATMLANYLSRFSAIADNKINCGPVLTWMEIDNKGNHLLVSEESSINVPAIAAAHVTKRYIAQATDELTFEVGDIVSVIDMPPKEDTGWWRGKHGFQVGFFPCDCVELINDKIPPSVQSSVPKPVCKKHGKLVTFLRSFMKSRPPPQKLRQRGILRERVFGCDLGEHLHNSGHEVPQVVKSCTEFIEKNGVVDGIYRLSGISSNIQKLRHEFDSEQIPELGRDVFRQDIHSVGSLCKLYFRELPNPLLTYQLYDRFSDAVSAATDEERLVKIHNVIQQLPPPHYRTLEFLMRHLSRLATFSSSTSMHTKNLAIVWAPNLLRSKQIESACFSGTAAFMEVRIQSVVVEFILNNTEALFSAKLNAIIRESTGNNTLSRPKSLMICSPSTKLLSLEEAQARTQAQLSSPATTPGYSQSDYIEVGEGPGALQGKFHTVIDLPIESVKRPPAKAKKSPVGNWFSFFHLSKSNSMSKRKLKRHPSEPNEIKSIALPGGRGDSGTLRSTKSEESLTSLHNLGGETPSYHHPLRPRSTSEAVSAVSRGDVQSSRTKGVCTTPLNNGRNGADRVRTAPCISPQEDDLELSPPAAGISTLDFDPMSFQCSPTSVTPGPQRSKDANKWRKNAGCSSESDPISSPNNISCFQSPEISPVVDESGKVTTSNQMSPQRRKQFKTQADVQSAFDALPSPLADRYEGSVTDGKVLRASNAHGNTQTVSQASAVTDISPSAQTLPDPGTDRLMSSVSVLPPHPPSMSAARKLALALAESAQKASSASRRGDNIQPRHQASPGPGRLHRPSHLDLEVYPQEYCGMETHFYHQSDHFPQSHHCTEPSQVTARQDSPCNFTPNVSPLGSGSFDEGSVERREVEEQTYESVGVSTPALSPPTSPIYANNDALNVYNFRAFLAETNMPASIEELIPRPPPSSSAQQHSPVEDRLLEEFSNHPLYPHHHWPFHAGRTSAPHCPRPSALPHHVRGLHRQSSEGRHSPLALRQPLSPQYRRYRRDDQLFSGVHRQQLQWQRSGERGVGQPAIRRARSFHAPQVSHYDFVGTEVVHPDGMFYIEPRPDATYQRPDATYQRFVPSGVRPERYNDCPSNPYPDRCPQTSVKHSQASIRNRGQSDYYNYSPQRLPPPPVNRELYIESSGTVVYEARDSEVFERVFYQPVRHKNTYLVGSPGDSPVSPVETKNRDIVHTRSKSDPGNACLLSADKAQSHSVPVASPTSPKSLHMDSDVTRQFVHRSGVGSNASRQMRMKQNLSQQPKLRKVPSLPERGCSNNERSHTRGHDQDRMMPPNFSVIGKPGILRRPARSQSTRENRDYYYHHVKSPLDPEHLGAFSTQPNRRTQSTKVRPTQRNHMEEYYAAHRAKPTRSSKAAAGYLPGQGCMSPRGHILLSKALGQEAFYNAALRSEAGVLE